MDTHINNGSRYATPPSRQATRLSTVDKMPMSAVIQTEPKSFKNHLANGNGESPLKPLRPTNSPRPHLDPRQLLDPKGYNSKKNMANPTSSSGTSDFTKTSQKHNMDEDEEYGMGNMIERIHNISERQEQPRKKRKTEKNDDGETTKAAFGGGGKSGEIGEYMKQKRQEGQKESGPHNVVVDLTEDNDEDEVVVLAENDDKMVCYGRLDSTKVQAHCIPNPGVKATYLTKSDWPAMKLQLHRLPGKSNNIIRVMDPSGTDFGNIDVRTALGLSPIMASTHPKFKTQARLTVRKKKPDEIPGNLCSEYFDVTINLYGPKNKATDIGKFLSQRQIYLRNPFLVDAGIEVYNPHAPKTGSLLRSTLPGRSVGSGTAYISRTVEEIRSDVLGMFDSLEKSENLPEMEPSPLITTKLLTHQKQGLHFMTNKEKERVFSDTEKDNSSLWRLKYRPNGQTIYYDIITGKEEAKKPPEVLGGILADMMGLGKTLLCLCLIVSTWDDCIEWAHQPPSGEGGQLLRRSKSTLLVSPLSTVANWEEQIAAHIAPGSFSYYIYHGSNRCQDVDALAEYDLIITTYHIVSSEVFGRGKKKENSPLLATNFFRIILDEAHIIREQSTRQSQAICTLSAQRRWAVTGTPVQNRLDDLGALIKFLRIQPYSEKGGFAQHILSPFKNADPEILPKLRLLVDSITLRRLKDRIDLPARHDDIVRLPFSEEESELYEYFAKDSDNRMKIIAKEQKKSLGGKIYVHILQAIMRLRLICAHGRELLRDEDLKLLEGHSWNSAIDLENESEKPVLSPRQAYEMLMLLKETDGDKCVQCARNIEPTESENGSDAQDVVGYMLPCYQIVCRDCQKDLYSTLDEREDHFVCPFCEQRLRSSFFELTQSGIEAAEEARIQARQNPKHAKIMGRYGGPHTKTKALIEALHQAKVESESLPPEKPIKSVVFSGWTAHLDLIQIALEDNGIRYVRLDGKMARTKRNAALDAFREDPDVTVIIISIAAGGLGLNLTTASRVYVMEPQFNPAAEAQAVDRVHRLGQTREVFISRFIMQNSFEERMLALQRKKENLADLSMSRGKLDKAEAAKQRLEELRSLFK